jgi:hypothetical protein
MGSRLVRRALVAAIAVAMAVVAVPTVDAWKPFTHVFTGNNAYEDALDGAVEINGVAYPVNPRLVLALQTKKPFYDAGVVGPDGYPDLVMGQSVIHPENTGKWLRHVLDKAWAAQTDPRYSESEKLEILAFSYGFLTHAAGDMWAHTLVNDFAQGVFPAVGEILSDPEAAAIAVRHIIVEGYIGDATPGYDGNHDRTFVAGEVNEDGDPEVSDDATPGIDYGIPPDLFLWEAFVGRAPDASGALTLPLPGQPTADRGPIQEFFYDLRNDLAEDAGSNSNIQQAVDNFNELQDDIDYALEQCSFPPDPIECPIALAILGFETLEALVDATTDLLEAGIEAIVDAYLAAWVDDIDNGLRHWSNVGNAFTTGLFDPSAYRAYQNETCGETGSGELSQARITCEDGVGIVGTFLDVLGESITTDDPHLLSMLGFPDFVAAGIELVDEVFDAIDALVDVPLPLENELAEFQQYLQDLLLDAISDAIGIDVELYAEILRNPSAYLDEGLPVPLPPPLDVFNDVGLFVDGEHERLDAIIGFDEPGLTDEHHDLGPDSNRRLDDAAQFIVEEFAPLENTITTAKLLLLDGDQLDAVLSNTLGRQMDTYPSGVTTNIMVNALDGGDPWLLSIDSDHAWRQDGLPRFCDDTPGALCSPGAEPRPPSLNGGRGQMPIWESCVARPAFAQLFKDWENGGQQFPDLGDGVSADPGSDPNAPTSSIVLDPDSAFYDDTANGRLFVGGDNVFTLTAVDTPAGKGFPVEQLEVQYRITGPDGTPGAWTAAEPNDTIHLDGPDGRYVIETQAGDPCHTLDPGDALPAESVRTFEYWLDTTPPVCTCNNPPFGATFATDELSTVDYDVDDGPIGSGVAAVSSIIDGYVETQETTAPIADGDPIDMYLLYPGTRTVTVTATDNIGNSGDTDCTFTLIATSASLLNNLERARLEGDVPNTDVYRGLRDKLNQAVRKHDQGQHAVEWKALDAFIEQIEGHLGGASASGSGIDPVVGRRFIAYAQDVITRAA